MPAEPRAMSTTEGLALPAVLLLLVSLSLTVAGAARTGVLQQQMSTAHLNKIQAREHGLAWQRWLLGQLAHSGTVQQDEPYSPPASLPANTRFRVETGAAVSGPVLPGTGGADSLIAYQYRIVDVLTVTQWGPGDASVELAQRLLIRESRGDH